jgi:serine/threonine-protein kinase
VIGSGFAGKFNYVSPEQLGLWDGNVTAKSDIYSLGLVLAECLTGQALDMGGSQLEVIDKRRVVPDLSQIDARLRPLIDRMLQSDPKDRPESMAVVAAWRPGGKAQTGSSIGAVSSGRTGELAAAASAPRRRLALGAVAAALVVLIGGTGAYFLFGQLAAPPAGTRVLPPNLNPDAGVDARQAEDARRAMAEAQERQRREQQDAARRNEQGQQVARTEPKPNAKALEGGLSAPDRPPSDFRERIRRFVSAYDGGDCFFVEPVLIAEQKTTLEGYGSSAAPFEVLDYEFKRANGFEATVGYHAVSARQCAAIGFLSRLRNPGAPRLRLDLSAGNLLSDGYISGSVSGFDNSRIELLMVDHVGMVQSLTDLLKGAGDIKTFIVNLRREDSGPPKLQLVLGVASNAALDALKPARPGSLEIGPADKVFAKVLDEAQQSRQTLNVGVKSFNFEK